MASTADRKTFALAAIDRVWKIGGEQLPAAAHTEWKVLLPIWAQLELVARIARTGLESGAGAGEPEPLHEARVILRMIEAGAGVVTYGLTATGPMYAKAVHPWATLTAAALARLPALRGFIEAMSGEDEPEAETTAAPVH